MRPAPGDDRRRARAPRTASASCAAREPPDQLGVRPRRDQQRARPRPLGAEAVAVQLDRARRLDDARDRAARAEHAPRRAPAPGARRGCRTRSRGARARHAPPTRAAGGQPRAAVRPGRAALRRRQPLLPALAHDRPRPQSVERTRHERRARSCPWRGLRLAVRAPAARQRAARAPATACTGSATIRLDGPSRFTSSWSRVRGRRGNPHDLARVEVVTGVDAVEQRPQHRHAGRGDVLLEPLRVLGADGVVVRQRRRPSRRTPAGSPTSRRRTRRAARAGPTA